MFSAQGLVGTSRCPPERAVDGSWHTGKPRPGETRAAASVTQPSLRGLSTLPAVVTAVTTVLSGGAGPRWEIPSALSVSCGAGSGPVPAGWGGGWKRSRPRPGMWLHNPVQAAEAAQSFRVVSPPSRGREGNTEPCDGPALTSPLARQAAGGRPGGPAASYSARVTCPWGTGRGAPLQTPPRGGRPPSVTAFVIKSATGLSTWLEQRTGQPGFCPAQVCGWVGGGGCPGSPSGVLLPRARFRSSHRIPITRTTGVIRDQLPRWLPCNSIRNLPVAKRDPVREGGWSPEISPRTRVRMEDHRDVTGARGTVGNLRTDEEEAQR